MDAHLAYYLLELAAGAFSFQITQQSDQVTNYVLSRQNRTFAAGNGWRVMIDQSPEVDVDNKIIYLQGRNSEKDERVHSEYGMNKKDGEKVVKAVHQALRECVEAAKNWKHRRNIDFIDTIVVRPGYCFDPYATLRNIPGVVVINNIS